jgi:hypothetical protein
MLAADTASAAIRSTHVTFDREALARAQAAGSRTLGRAGGPAGLAIVEAPFPFTAIAALTNPGSDGALHIRVSADGLVWSAPTYLPDDEPNPALDERGRAHPFALDRVSALHFPKLRGGAVARFVAFEFQGAISPPARVALHFIDAGTDPSRPPSAGERSQGARLLDDGPVAHPLKPAIIRREEWGARPAKYEYTLTLARHLAVHHTAGVGDGLAETTQECAAQVRGIQAFHQDSRGWNDIGYSYLVCGNGEIFQAREDDDDATDVWGAHDGYNRGSMSVSMMGYFHPPYNQVPSPLQLDGLTRTLAWVAEIRAVDPLDESLYEAFGEVRTNIYGHREVRATDCPGNTLFAMKNALRASVAEILELFRNPAVR